MICGYNFNLTATLSSSPLDFKRDQNPSLYQQHTTEAKLLYGRTPQRIKIKCGPTKLSPKSIKEKREKVQAESRMIRMQEKNDFLNLPSNASFISFRDDSKYSNEASEAKLSGTMEAIEHMATYLEIENSVRIQESYDSINLNAKRRDLPMRRNITAPIGGPSMLSHNYRVVDAKETKSDDGYLDEVTPQIDVLYRRKLDALRRAHLLKPEVDGRDCGVPDDAPIHNSNNAWFWGQHNEEDEQIDAARDDFRNFADEAKEEHSSDSYYWGDKGICIDEPDEQDEEGDDFIFGYDENDEDEEEEEQEPSLNWRQPEQNAYSDGSNGPVVIMQLYSRICNMMSKLVQDSILDFKQDPLYTKGSLFHFAASAEHIRSLMDYAATIDKTAATEYLLFQSYWSDKRAIAADAVAELFEKADQLQKKYDSKYLKAEEEFLFTQSQSTLELMNPSTSNKRMDEIKAEAEAALHIVGQDIQKSQALEARLIMDFRSAEFTAISSTQQWKNVFSQLFEKLRYLKIRYEYIHRQTAARMIQRAVWRKLFLWDPRSNRPPNPFDPRSDELYLASIKADGSHFERGLQASAADG